MKQISIFCVLLIVYGCVIGQQFAPLKSAIPSTAGFSPERLTRLDNSLQSWVSEQKMNGIAALIVKDGKIVYHKAFGFNDPAQKLPYRTDAIFRIASQSKAITSVAIMMLLEEGKILLTDPVSKFIPEFKNPKIIDQFNEKDTSWTTIPSKREITIKDLLTHTSGIGYAQIGSKQAKMMYSKYGITCGIGVKEGFILGDVIKKLGKLPLFHQPGEKYTYGLNTDVLGYVVEVVSGKTFEAFLTERLFLPLGMNDTYFYIPENKQNRLVQLYTQDSTGIKPMDKKISITDDFYRDYPTMKSGYFSGGGGLSSTLMDYAVFLQMLLNGGTYNGKQILSHNTVRMMTSNQIDETVMGGDWFGLGFGLTTEKEAAGWPQNVGTFEWGGMFATTYWVDPKEKLIGLMFRNIWPTNFDAPTRFKILTYQALTN
jgi:CubicO group peptidase (beta-lactamase class C family)